MLTFSQNGNPISLLLCSSDKSPSFLNLTVFNLNIIMYLLLSLLAFGILLLYTSKYIINLPLHFFYFYYTHSINFTEIKNKRKYVIITHL